MLLGFYVLRVFFTSRKGKKYANVLISAHLAMDITLTIILKLVGILNTPNMIRLCLKCITYGNQKT